jgi:hypothetical protein
MPALAKLKSSGQLAAAALVALVGLLVGLTAIWHAFDPARVGLWSGPNAFFFGVLDAAAAARIEAHQLPAGTLYVVTVMVVGLCYFVARELLGFARAGFGR